MKTHFAPAERKTAEQVQQQYDAFNSPENIQRMLDAMPCIAAVLNSERQILFCSQALLDYMGCAQMSQLLGMRPGEFLQCVHTTNAPGGCGTGEQCQYCGAIQAVICAQRDKTTVIRECQLRTAVDGIEENHDFEVTATPLELKGESCTVIAIADIADRKRRQSLERAFFHDVVDLAGGLHGFIGALRECDDLDTVRRKLRAAHSVSENLINEIQEHRQLLLAERGDLEVEPVLQSSLSLLERCVQRIQHHKVTAGRTIVITPESEDFLLKTDVRIFSRVIANLIKNAAEAVEEGAQISVTCRRDGDGAEFEVANPGEIPQETQLQLFQRSFSTKGRGRGTGTYSVKLLTERYLKGQVKFRSSATEGTIFAVLLPLSPEWP